MRNTEELRREYRALLTGRWITDLSNTAAFIRQEIPNLNWAGFYLLHDDKLVLGPFSGKPACTDIALGRGVCGVCAQTKKAQVVNDVNLFPGHIACDPASRSELVVPLLGPAQEVYGVLDLDSNLAARFSDTELRVVEGLVQELLQACKPRSLV